MNTRQRVEEIIKEWAVIFETPTRDTHEEPLDAYTKAEMREMALEEHRNLAELSDVIPLTPFDLSRDEAERPESHGESIVDWERRESLARELCGLGAHDVLFRLIEDLPGEPLNGALFEHTQRQLLFKDLIADLLERAQPDLARKFVAQTTMAMLEKVDATIQIAERTKDPMDIFRVRADLDQFAQCPDETLHWHLIVKRYMCLWDVTHEPTDLQRAIAFAARGIPSTRVDSQLTIAMHTGEAKDYIQAFDRARQVDMEFRAWSLEKIVDRLTIAVMQKANVLSAAPVSYQALREILIAIPGRYRSAIIRRIGGMGGSI